MADDRITRAREVALSWTKEPFDAGTRSRVESILARDDDEEILRRFGDTLHFGTAGLRGIIGTGTTMMNEYTIAKASRALAQCLLEDYKDQDAANRGVVIGYDCRYKSEVFANVTAGVLLKAGIKCHLFVLQTPTPLVPYAMLKLNAFAGIMVTSSHNPKDYNGYKVFWSNGAQIISPVDVQVAKRMDVLPDESFEFVNHESAQKTGQLSLLSHEMIDDYVDWAVKTSTFTHETDVNVVYTPLGGVGGKVAMQAFQKAGFESVHIVKEEERADADFAGLHAPNPERRGTWYRALAWAEAKKADIILATDGDADRLGVAVPVDGEYKILGGNEIGALILYHLLSNRPKEQLNKDSFAICSVVSSPLTAAICNHFGIDFQETLTGFKWMGNVADERTKKGDKFVFAYEEAFGFTFGSARDKDGIIACILLSELAAHCKAQGKRVIDVIKDIHCLCGLHIEGAAERFYEGSNGSQTMAELLNRLRNDPPKHIAGIEVESVRDLKSLTTTVLKTGEKLPVTHLPKQDMLTFRLVDKSWISIRPSGTEPKIKAYLGVIQDTNTEDYEEDQIKLSTKLQLIRLAVKKLL